VLKLEVVFHLPGGDGVPAQVLALGDGEDDEERGGKHAATDRGDGLGEKVNDCRGEQDQEDG